MKKFFLDFLEFIVIIHRSWNQNMKGVWPELDLVCLNFKKIPMNSEFSSRFDFFRTNFGEYFLIFEKSKIIIVLRKTKNFSLKPLSFLSKKLKLEIFFLDNENDLEYIKTINFRKKKIGTDYCSQQFFRTLCEISTNHEDPEKTVFFDITSTFNFLENINGQKFFGLFVKGSFSIFQNFRKKILTTFQTFFKREDKPQDVITLKNKVGVFNFSQNYPYILKVNLTNIQDCFTLKTSKNPCFVKEGPFHFLISSNLGFGKFFSYTYKGVFVDPSCVQITFYQLLKKFSTFCIFNRFRPNLPLMWEEIFKFQKNIFSEKIQSKTFEVRNIFSPRAAQQMDFLNFGTIYRIKSFLCNISDAKSGFSSLIFSDSFFFSPNGLFISGDQISSKNIKKVVFFSGHIPGKECSAKNRKKLLKRTIKKFNSFLQKILNLKKEIKNGSDLNKKIQKICFFNSKFLLVPGFYVSPRSNLSMVNSRGRIFIRQKNFFFSFDLVIIKKIRILQIKSSLFLLLEFLPNRITTRNVGPNFSFLGEIFFQIKKKTELSQIFKQVEKFKKSEKKVKNFFLFYEKSNEKKFSKFNIPYLNNLNTKTSFSGNKRTHITVCLLENSIYFTETGDKKFQEIKFKLVSCIFYQENKKSGHFLILLEFSEFPEFLFPIKKLKIQVYFENCNVMEKLTKKKKFFTDISNSDEEFQENLKNERISKNFDLFVFFLRKISGQNIQKTNDFISFWGIKDKKNLFFSVTRSSLISFDLWPPLILNFCDFELCYMERNFSGARSFDLVLILNQLEKSQEEKNFSWIRILSVENNKFRLVQKLSQFHGIKFLSGPLNINWNLTLKMVKKEWKSSFEKKSWEILTNEDDSNGFTDYEDEPYLPDMIEFSNGFNPPKIEDNIKEERLDWEDLIKSIE